MKNCPWSIDSAEGLIILSIYGETCENYFFLNQVLDELNMLKASIKIQNYYLLFFISL